MNKVLFCFFLLISLAGCKKDDHPELPFIRIETGYTSAFKDVFIVSSDTIFLSGGNENSGIIYGSVDGGKNFYPSSTYFDNAINSLFFTDSKTGFAADADILIYKTVDGGVTWNPFYATEYPLSVNRNLRDIWFTNDSTGFVCGGKNLGNGVLFKTLNAGSTWSFTEFEHEWRGICFTTPLNGVMCGYGAIVKTNNGGQTWLNVASKYFYTGIAKNSNGNLFACCLSGDVFVSYNEGTTWFNKRKESSLTETGDQFLCIDISPSGRIICAGVDGVVSWSDDNGNFWTTRKSFDNKDVNSIKWINNLYVMAVGKDGGVYKAEIF